MTAKTLAVGTLTMLLRLAKLKCGGGTKAGVDVIILRSLAAFTRTVGVSNRMQMTPTGCSVDGQRSEVMLGDE